LPLSSNGGRSPWSTIIGNDMTKGAGRAIIHRLKWESSTGDLDDLSAMKLREHISWKAPDRNVQPFVIREYRSGGKHWGQGNAASTPADIDHGIDTHSALGPFSPEAFKLGDGVELVFVTGQVYEMHDGRRWQPIPRSRYRTTRTVSRKGGRLGLQITKAGAGVSVSNSTTG